MILLHRPLLTFSHQNKSKVLPRSTLVDSRNICTESATQICRLLQRYRQHYSLRRAHVQTVHSLLTAGLIHAENWCYKLTSNTDSAHGDLLFCAQALGELGQTYHSSMRALEALTTLRRNWRDEAPKSGVSAM